MYVVRASRDFSRSDRLSINGLEAMEISGKDLPSGAIAFQTRGAADVFITSSGRYIISSPIQQDDIITAEVLSNEEVEGQVDPSDLPRTLSELISYMNAYPDRAMLIDKTTYIGTRILQEGDKVDIWIEESRTSGAFGQISLAQLDTGVLVRRALDSSGPKATEPDMDNESDVATPRDKDGGDIQTQQQEEEKKSDGLSLDSDGPEVMRRFNATKGQIKAAFTTRQDESMVDLLGNGAACLQGDVPGQSIGIERS